MDGAEREVIEALQSPLGSIRYIDRQYPHRRIYYKESHDYYIKVVVEYEDDQCSGIGHLFTAYMPDRMPKGELPEK